MSAQVPEHAIIPANQECPSCGATGEWLPYEQNISFKTFLINEYRECTNCNACYLFVFKLTPWFEEARKVVE